MLRRKRVCHLHLFQSREFRLHSLRCFLEHFFTCHTKLVCKLREPVSVVTEAEIVRNGSSIALLHLLGHLVEREYQRLHRLGVVLLTQIVRYIGSKTIETYIDSSVRALFFFVVLGHQLFLGFALLSFLVTVLTVLS